MRCQEKNKNDHIVVISIAAQGDANLPKSQNKKLVTKNFIDFFWISQN